MLAASCSNGVPSPAGSIAARISSAFFIHRRFEEVDLRGEVVVKQRLGDTRRLRDLAHRQILVGVFAESPRAGVDQLPPALVHLQAGVGGLGHGVHSNSC